MVFWVYLSKDAKGNFTTFLTSHLDRAFASEQPEGVIVYLRPFTIPIDAVSHKHLLDDLSYRSLQRLSMRYKRQTKAFLEQRFDGIDQ